MGSILTIISLGVVVVKGLGLQEYVCMRRPCQVLLASWPLIIIITDVILLFFVHSHLYFVYIG